MQAFAPNTAYFNMSFPNETSFEYFDLINNIPEGGHVINSAAKDDSVLNKNKRINPSFSYSQGRGGKRGRVLVEVFSGIADAGQS